MQQVVSYTIFPVRQFIISRLVAGQKLRMKDLNQIWATVSVGLTL